MNAPWSNCWDFDFEGRGGSEGAGGDAFLSFLWLLLSNKALDIYSPSLYEYLLSVSYYLTGVVGPRDKWRGCLEPLAPGPADMC